MSAVRFLASHKEPGAAETARARHRRNQLPCTPDLTAALMALVAEAGYDMPARDRRHETATAWPDIQDWLTYLDVDGKSARTLYAYERSTAPLLRTHPGKTLAEFTSGDVTEELGALPPRSRYISRSIYKQLFDWALEQERIERSPMTKVPKSKAGHRRPKDIFAPDEIARLVALPAPDGPLMAILFGTGLRKAEARRLRRSDINLDRMRLMVYGGKGDKDGMIPFGVTVAAAVADLDLFERLGPDDHLWHLKRWPVGDYRRRRDPIGDTTFSTWWADKVSAAGVRYLNPHQTRHTYHWLLRTEGLALDDRAALMRHSSGTTTDRQYGRIEFEDLAAKVAGF